MAAPTAPGAFAVALTADLGVVDLDPWPGGAKQVTAVPFDHCLHQLVLDPPGGVGRDPEPATQFDVGQALLALSQQMHGGETKPASAAWCPARRYRRSAMSDTDSAGIAAVDDRGSRNTLRRRTADT